MSIMNAETEIKIAEDLLTSEIDQLARYNRLLEQPLDGALAELLRRLRDEEIRRIDQIQSRLEAYRLSSAGASA